MNLQEAQAMAKANADAQRAQLPVAPPRPSDGLTLQGAQQQLAARNAQAFGQQPQMSIGMQPGVSDAIAAQLRAGGAGLGAPQQPGIPGADPTKQFAPSQPYPARPAPTAPAAPTAQPGAPLAALSAGGTQNLIGRPGGKGAARGGKNRPRTPDYR